VLGLAVRQDEALRLHPDLFGSRVHLVTLGHPFAFGCIIFKAQEGTLARLQRY